MRFKEPMKCVICGTEEEKKSNNQKYCKRCAFGVQLIQARINYRKKEKRRKEVWVSLSDKEKSEILNKISKYLLEEGDGKNNS